MLLPILEEIGSNMITILDSDFNFLVKLMIETKGHTDFVLPSLVNFDELFSRTPNTTVFNEIMLDRTPEELNDILCDISGDRSDSVATCDCGEMVGNYYDGQTCGLCGTVCASNIFGEIRNDSWLEIPKAIKGVLNPQAYRIISKWFGISRKQNILSLILDMSQPVEAIADTPFFSGMGFNWFYDNFEKVITFFLLNHPSPTGRKKGPMMKLFIEQAGTALWCTKLPILSKIIQPVYRVNDSLRYADEDIQNLFKAIITLKSILLAEKMMKFTSNHIDRNFFKVYIEFITYTNQILKEKLPRKPSMLRKHIFGSRSHCTARSVAVPITGPHHSDEIYLPWKIGLTMYRYHILSVLEKRNMSVLAAFDRVMNAMNVYDHEIDLIMQQLVSDSPYRGLPILMNRNPSLRVGSIQLLFVTKIKPALSHSDVPLPVSQPTDAVYPGDSDVTIGGDQPNAFAKARQLIMSIEDATVEVSPQIVKGPNLDFDGDEINLLPIFEMSEVPKFMRLYPAHRFISNDKLTIEGGDVTLSPQQFCLLSAWMNDPEAAL